MFKINPKYTYVFLICITFLGVNACKTKNISKDQPTVEVETQLEKSKTEKSIKPAYVLENQPYQPTKTMVNDLIHTKLSVSFDWQKQHLFGEAELTIAPYFYPQDKVTLDAKGFDIQEVALIKNNQKQMLTYTYKDSLYLIVQLDKKYLKGEKYQLFIKYTAKPNELNLKSGSGAISDDKGLYFINPLGTDTTKPRQIWTQGETESSSCWFPTFDQPNEKTTEEIAITVDNKFVTLSNGIMEAQMSHEDGTRTDYWVQSKPHAPYLFMMAIGEFAVIYDSWLPPSTGEKIEVNYYVEKDFEPYAKKIFGNTPEMLGFFSKKLGYEYPWDKYSQIIVRDYVSGAMENTSAAIFMEALQLTDRELLDKNWDYIIAHELFHHWFGDLVTCESWGNLALNESFANYSEYLWYEYKFGKDYADAHRQEEMNDYLHESEKKQVPIVRSNYVHRMDMFDSHSYAKGGLVLHMLRNQIGDEAFFESLRNYLHKNEFTDVELDELRLAFEETTGLDLNQFFNQWFLSPGHPNLLVEDEYKNDTLSLTITQRQDSLYTPYYYIPTSLEVMVEGIKQKVPLVIEGKVTKIQIPLSKEPEYVLFDPEKTLLAVVEHTNSTERNSKMLSSGVNFQSRYDALDQLMMDFANSNYALKSPAEATKAGLSISKLDSLNTLVLNKFIEALADPSENIKLLSLETLKSYEDKKKEELRDKYLYLIRNDSASSVRAAALANLAAIVKKEDVNQLEIQVVKQALEDPSYQVLGEALLAGMSLELQGIDSTVQKYINSDKTNIVKAIGKFFVKTGEKTRDQWAINAFNKINSSDLISLIDMFAEISKASEIESQKKLIYFFYDQGINGDNIYTRYTCYRILHAIDNLEGVRALRQEVIAKEVSTMLLGVYKSWESSLNK